MNLYLTRNYAIVTLLLLVTLLLIPSCGGQQADLSSKHPGQPTSPPEATNTIIESEPISQPTDSPDQEASTDSKSSDTHPQEPSNTPTQEPTTTPTEEPTNTPTQEPTNTPEPQTKAAAAITEPTGDAVVPADLPERVTFIPFGLESSPCSQIGEIPDPSAPPDFYAKTWGSSDHLFIGQNLAICYKNFTLGTVTEQIIDPQGNVVRTAEFENFSVSEGGDTYPLDFRTYAALPGDLPGTYTITAQTPDGQFTTTFEVVDEVASGGPPVGWLGREEFFSYTTDNVDYISLHDFEPAEIVDLFLYQRCKSCDSYGWYTFSGVGVRVNVNEEGDAFIRMPQDMREVLSASGSGFLAALGSRSGQSEYSMLLDENNAPVNRFTSHTLAIEDPDWRSSDEIAYIDNSDIWLIDPQTTKKKLLAQLDYTMVTDLSWSPDGESLLFVAQEEPEDDFDIYQLHVDNPESAPIRLTDDPRSESSPLMASDGTLFFARYNIVQDPNSPRLAYNQMIVRKAPDGTETIIAGSETDISSMFFHPKKLSLSHDEQTLAVTYAAAAFVMDVGLFIDLTAGNSESLRDKVNWQYNDGDWANTQPWVDDLDWANTQPWIVVQEREDGIQEKATAMYVLDFSSQPPEYKFIFQPANSIGIMDWSPDDKWIVFDQLGLFDQSLNDRRSSLWIISADGGNLQQLSNVGRFPAWRPNTAATQLDLVNRED